MHKHFVWKWSTQICLHATYTHTFGVINTGLDTLSGNRERQWSDPGFNHSWLADLRRLIVQRKWLKVNSLYVNVLILLSITSTRRPILSLTSLNRPVKPTQNPLLLTVKMDIWYFLAPHPLHITVIMYSPDIPCHWSPGTFCILCIHKASRWCKVRWEHRFRVRLPCHTTLHLTI